MPHVTFIHGIANKPPADELRDLWERALAFNGGIDLGAEGVTSCMVYWADIMYVEPKADTAAYENTEGEFERSDDDIDLEWMAATAGTEAAFVGALAGRLNFDAPVDEEAAPSELEAGAEFERIPLPGWLKRRLMKSFLRDVHHYLYNVSAEPRAGEAYEVQVEIRRRVLEALAAGAEEEPPHVVVAHSMGTVIAYDCLKRVPEVPGVDGLMTIGSPLGLDEIQDTFKPEWSKRNGFVGDNVTGRWVNVFDRLDPVAGLDPGIAGDYQRDGEKVVRDVSVTNDGKWRHSVSKYLGQRDLREPLGEMLDL